MNGLQDLTSQGRSGGFWMKASLVTIYYPFKKHSWLATGPWLKLNFWPKDTKTLCYPIPWLITILYSSIPYSEPKHLSFKCITKASLPSGFHLELTNARSLEVRRRGRWGAYPCLPLLLPCIAVILEMPMFLYGHSSWQGATFPSSSSCQPQVTQFSSLSRQA